MSNPTSAATITRLELGGMGCGSCAETITDLLNGLPGVSEASVDFDAKLARISHDPSLTAASLVKAIEDAGYQAKQT